MKRNEAKAKKIITQFKAKFPLLTVIEIYDCEEGTIVKAKKDPEEFKMGVPYYQILDNVVINANPYGRPEFFKTVVKEDNCIYRNSDVDSPPMPKFINLEGGNE